MSAPITPAAALPPPAVPGGGQEMPIFAHDMPVLFEDEGQEEMGESTPHTAADQILSMGIADHLRGQPEYRVFSNLNVHYHPVDRRAYVSPDVMVVRCQQPLPAELSSYRIGPEQPAPVLVVEILSGRSPQQLDLTIKPDIYAQLGVREHILVDGSGEFLTERLVIRRRVDETTWHEEQDADGGVTSVFGFRVILEDDGQPRVIDRQTGYKYPRPLEAGPALRAEAEARRQAEALARAEGEARRLAEERLRALEAELARLKAEHEKKG